MEAQPTSAAKGSCTIFVKNLSWGTDENGLKKFLKSCGSIVDVRVGESYLHMLSGVCGGAEWTSRAGRRVAFGRCGYGKGGVGDAAH